MAYFFQVSFIINFFYAIHVFSHYQHVRHSLRALFPSLLIFSALSCAVNVLIMVERNWTFYPFQIILRLLIFSPLLFVTALIKVFLVTVFFYTVFLFVFRFIILRVWDYFFIDSFSHLLSTLLYAFLPVLLSCFLIFLLTSLLFFLPSHRFWFLLAFFPNILRSPSVIFPHPSYLPHSYS